MPSTENYITQASADARYQARGGLSSSTPNVIEPDDPAAAGVSTSASRADHEHGIVAAVPTTVNLDGSVSLAEGSATSFARSDHKHVIDTTGAWTSYTPTFTNTTLGHGTVVGALYKVGRTVHFRARFILGSTSAMGTNPTCSLPVAATSVYTAGVDRIGDVALHDSGTTDYIGFGRSDSSTTVQCLVSRADGTYITGALITATVPMTWAANDRFLISGTYEAAS